MNGMVRRYEAFKRVQFVGDMGSDQEEHEKGAHAGQAYAQETYCENKCMNSATLPQARGLHECAPHFNEVSSLDYSRSGNASPNAYCAQDSL